MAWSPVDSPPKGQCRGALVLFLICSWTNGWANNRDTGDFRRHRAYYDVTVMYWLVAVHHYITLTNAILICTTTIWNTSGDFIRHILWNLAALGDLRMPFVISQPELLTMFPVTSGLSRIIWSGLIRNPILANKATFLLAVRQVYSIEHFWSQQNCCNQWIPEGSFLSDKTSHHMTSLNVKMRDLFIGFSLLIKLDKLIDRNSVETKNEHPGEVRRERMIVPQVHMLYQSKCQL